MRLKSLEILDSGEVSSGDGDHALRIIIGAFKGLQEFFISQCGPIEPLNLWKRVVRYHGTLRRFVYHQRTIDLDDESFTFEEEFDASDLTIPNQYFRYICDKPTSNPLCHLNLEGLGLSCTPNRLVRTPSS